MTEDEAYSELIKGYDLDTLLDIAANIDRRKHPFRYALLTAEIEKRRQEAARRDDAAATDGARPTGPAGEGRVGEGPAGEGVEGWGVEGEGYSGEGAAREGPARKPRPPLNAWRAVLIFLIFLAVQIAGGFVIGFFAGIAFAISGVDIHDPEVFKEFEPVLVSVVTLGGLLIGIPVMAALSIRWGREQLLDRSSTGMGVSPGSRKSLITGFLAGAATSMAYLFLFSPLVPVDVDDTALGPMTEMAATPGFPRWIWIVIALLLAPPVEEFLFRGVMLGGFTRSMGPLAAAAIASVLFVGSHVFEAIHYWPAFLGIGTMALVTLHFRWKSRALGPAVAVHFGYNLVLVSVVLLGG